MKLASSTILANITVMWRARCWLGFSEGELSAEMSSTPMKSPVGSNKGAVVQVKPMWVESK